MRELVGAPLKLDPASMSHLHDNISRATPHLAWQSVFSKQSCLRCKGIFMKFEAIYKMLPLAVVVQRARCSAGALMSVDTYRINVSTNVSCSLLCFKGTLCGSRGLGLAPNCSRASQKGTQSMCFFNLLTCW